MTLSQLVVDPVERGDGDEVAVIHGDRSWSFSDLRDRAGSLAAEALRGVADHHTVAVLGENHPDTIAAYYGIPAAGRILTFLNHRLAPREILHQLERSSAGFLLASPEQARRMGPHLGDLPTLLFGADLPPAALGTHASTDDPAWLLFTSGTTGAPKAALLSHASLLAAIASSSEARPMAPDDVFAFPFPLCHVAGYNVLRSHAHGRPVVLLDRFTALPNTAGCFTANEAVRTLRTSSYGAAPMPLELLRRTDALLDVDLSQGFGMTELSGNALFLDATDHQRGFTHDESILRAAGRPGPGVTLRLVDHDDRDVAQGEVGEICIAGDQVMLGYLDEPEATAEALRGGWMHTGDLGRLRPDGLLEVVDRLKDMIVTGGENVASLEVERAITSVCPEVGEVAVIGTPDARWGENVCACVTLAEGSVLELDELARRLEHTLAGFKTPRHLVVLDELPVTHSGKVAKEALRDLLADQPVLLGPRRGSAR